MEIRSNVIDGFVNGFFEDNWLLWIILNDSISGWFPYHPSTHPCPCCMSSGGDKERSLVDYINEE